MGSGGVFCICFCLWFFFFGMAYQTFILHDSFLKVNALTFFVFNRCLVVVHFWAPWAPQCAQMNEVMAALAKEHTQVTFVKVSQAVELVLKREDPLLQNMGKVIFSIPLWLHV